jgi:hypothetical protein
LLPPARRVEPAWAEPNRERKRKHVTLQFLLAEYIEANPDGYCYSRFCDFYRGWVSRLSVTMRQAHLGGDELFVDHAGVLLGDHRSAGGYGPAGAPVRGDDGQVESVVRARVMDKTLAGWIDAHVHASAYFGDAPAIWRRTIPRSW